jgi:hypothetical protein
MNFARNPLCEPGELQSDRRQQNVAQTPALLLMLVSGLAAKFS